VLHIGLGSGRPPGQSILSDASSCTKPAPLGASQSRQALRTRKSQVSSGDFAEYGRLTGRAGLGQTMSNFFRLDASRGCRRPKGSGCEPRCWEARNAVTRREKPQSQRPLGRHQCSRTGELVRVLAYSVWGALLFHYQRRPTGRMGRSRDARLFRLWPCKAARAIMPHCYLP